MRQIKARTDHITIPFLISFDERFSEYEHALERAGIFLVVLPKDILNRLK